MIEEFFNELVSHDHLLAFAKAEALSVALLICQQMNEMRLEAGVIVCILFSLFLLHPLSAAFLYAE